MPASKFVTYCQNKIEMCRKWILDYSLPVDTKNIFNKIISLFLKVHLFILSEHNGLLVFQMPYCIFLEDLKKFLGFVYVGMWFSWVWISAHWPDYIWLLPKICLLFFQVLVSLKDYKSFFFFFKTINLLSAEVMSFGIVYLSCDTKIIGETLILFS